jgi:hypothetical protein
VGYALAEDAGGEGAPKYAVHINFSETYTEADLAAAADILRMFDPDADMMILESFPPQGVAIIESDDEGVCDAIEAAFEGKTYVSSVSCEPYVPVGGDGDEPVSTNND